MPQWAMAEGPRKPAKPHPRIRYLTLLWPLNTAGVVNMITHSGTQGKHNLRRWQLEEGDDVRPAVLGPWLRPRVPREEEELEDQRREDEAAGISMRIVRMPCKARALQS